MYWATTPVPPLCGLLRECPTAMYVCYYLLLLLLLYHFLVLDSCVIGADDMTRGRSFESLREIHVRLCHMNDRHVL